jgi:hypothetical protein
MTHVEIEVQDMDAKVDWRLTERHHRLPHSGAS